MKNYDHNPPVERHVVLVSPEVHWNTGNIGRTCLGADACLHLIEPIGFSLESKQIKRAGLDYWSRVKLFLWKDFNDFFNHMAPEPGQMLLFSKSSSKNFWSMPSTTRLFLVFGSETRGLPKTLLDTYADNCYHIPITSRIRCLNLSTSVGIVLYESLRPKKNRGVN